MAMVVKNNMTAINTLNTLNKNSSALSKSLQKVSSGMKINSAADDASGYAISERMRVQIRSLDQANQNTQNGSSMMKVAEGAVSSTVEILKTLKEKAVNAANDSNTDSDRQTIQKELDQSIDQINDNANVTFNGKYLVDGSKNTIGNATYTALSNQSLSTDTTGATKLVDLKARSGDSLEIHDTDKVTVSYVKGGKTYSATFNVKEDDGTEHTLQDIFTKMEEIDTNSKVFANASNASISKATGVTYTAQDIQDAVDDATGAKKTAYDTAVSAKNTQEDATKAHADAVAAIGNYVNGTPANNTGLVKEFTDAFAAYNAVAGADKLAAGDIAKTGNTGAAGGQAVKSVLDAVAADAKWGTVTGGTSAEAVALSKAYNALKTANEKAWGADGTGATGGTKKDLKDADDAMGQLNNAAGTQAGYAEIVGEYLAAKEKADSMSGVKLMTGSEVGVAASGDVVNTASGGNAITVTANNEGIGGQISGLNISVSDSQGNVKKSANAALDAFEETVRAQNKSDDNAISLQVGAKANQSIKVGLTDMRAEALGLQGADGTKLNISTQGKANAAINVLDNAIQKALDQQTTIGSVESRLEYTSSNLTTASENVQASESTIRDADMAKEMTNYTKNNVLLQAAQSMLAQANQSSSNVLSLLQ